ncbi:MAG: DUF4240 domain-containing protein [Chthoniobacterales bacterium]
MKEELFWGTIELAWETLGGCHVARQQLIDGEAIWSGRIERLVEISMPKVIEALRSRLENAEREELLDFARVLGERLCTLDQPAILRSSRAEEGEGFLFSRSFIVLLGRAYYEAVLCNPPILMEGLQCEDLWNLPASVYERRFGVVAPHVDNSVEEWPAQEAEEESGFSDEEAYAHMDFFDGDEVSDPDQISLRGDREITGLLPEADELRDSSKERSSED